MNTTSNMGLRQPDLTDQANIGDLNFNAGKLDTHRHSGDAGDGLPVRAVQSGPGAPTVSANPPGQLWADTTHLVLYISNGSAWTLVGGGEVEITALPVVVTQGGAQIFSIGEGVNASKVEVHKNGLLKLQGQDRDYLFTSGSNSIQFNTAPVTGDVIVMKYVPA